ncbi:MAG TPA: hypothetical protein VGR06_07810 [Actinophytocola sp.]|jgi:hypothetical protein|uniref:hypothetical protein n=1 Tax=Actinophytocola sp. TaxID=1872138 RepID=UPI002E0B70FA|nr:hypothetical protein [Actinophytocola sp.]
MGRDLATQAELVKLARALDTTPDEVSFAGSLDHRDIRRLRERVVDALYEEHRATFGRIAMITRLLPTPLNVRITLRAFPPLLAARIAGEMAPDRAAELVNRMPIEYLADGCLHLEPRRAAPLISHIHPDRVVAVVQELVARGEYVTIGHLLDAATERIVRDVAAVISDEALLRIGCYAESDTQLTTAVAALPPERLRGIVASAVGGPPELRSAGLALIARLADDELRARLAEYAAESDDEALTRLLHTAIDDGAVPELLTLFAALGEHTQRRVLTLPALTDPDVRTQLTKAVTAHPLESNVTFMP